MKIFLDSSVILSAAGSEQSLSRLIVTVAPAKQWHLITSTYCRTEVTRNIKKLGGDASHQWEISQNAIEFVPDAYSGRRPLLLAASKDKPVLLSALAADSNVLLTLDQKDFSVLLHTAVYRMFVTTPKQFLIKMGFLE